MATINQSIELRRRVVGPDPRFVGTAIAIAKFLVKHTDIIKNRRGSSKSNSSNGRSIRKSNGGASKSSDEGINKIISILKDIESDVKEIKEQITNISKIITEFKYNQDKQKEKKEEKKDKKTENVNTANAWWNLIKNGLYTIALLRLLQNNGLKNLSGSLQSKLEVKSESPPPNNETTLTLNSLTSEENQAKLDEALNNLSVGINSWLDGRKGLDPIIQRRTDIKGVLSDSLASWQETINEKLAERNENRKIENRRKGMQDSFKASVEEWQKAISETLGNRAENEEIHARREGMKNSFVKGLEQLQ